MSMMSDLAANVAKLPEIAFTIMPTTGKIIIVKRGEKGYWPYEDGVEPTGEAAIALMNELNERIGVTWQEREAMANGSTFGFHCPCADLDVIEKLDGPTDPFVVNPNRYSYSRAG